MESIITNKELHGRAIRLALLSSHYKKPLDWTDKLLEDAKKTLLKFYKLLHNKNIDMIDDKEFIEALYDDLNTPKAIARLHILANTKQLPQLLSSLNLIGLGF